MTDRVYRAGQRFLVKGDGRTGKLLSVTFAESYEIVILLFFDHPQKMGYPSSAIELVGEETPPAAAEIEVAHV